MGQWKDLPNAVRLQIVEKLQHDEGSWRSANKEMYSMYQSFSFKAVSINLGYPDRTLDAILNSPTELGQYVKQVNLIQLSPPDDLNMIDPANDPLYQLIKHTHEVKEVELPEEAPIEDREYFNLALLENDNWKLHKLPDLYEDLTNVSTYFNYAHHVRNSLRNSAWQGE